MLVLARENHLQMPRKYIQLLLSLRQPRCTEGMERNQLSHQQLQFRAYSLVRPCDSGPLEELLGGFLCPERLKMSTSLLTRRGLLSPCPSRLQRQLGSSRGPQSAPNGFWCATSPVVLVRIFQTLCRFWGNLSWDTCMLKK